jgi:hypothetical protein
MTLRTNEKNISTTTTDTMSANTRIAADTRNGNGNFKVVDCKGKAKSVTSDELDKRPEDLTYFAFMCTVEPQDVDGRILQERLSVNFSL